MSEESSSLPAESHFGLEVWKESRSGAWASRGFHYQHWVAVLILVRQWAGLEPPGYLVPEGFEDCVLELSGRRIWIQIKSRKDATFQDGEVRRILDAVDGMASKLESGADIQSAVILEQPRTNKTEYDINRLFDDEDGKLSCLEHRPKKSSDCYRQSEDC